MVLEPQQQLPLVLVVEDLEMDKLVQQAVQE
jgi:hypothetical protein